jgi:ATP-dependent exoDNAse (exonuclease V) alpha subunit
MQKIIELGRVVDICGILNQLKKRSINANIVVRLLNEIEVPKMYAKNSNDDIVWYKAGMLFGKLELQKDQFIDFNMFTQVKDGVTFFYGCLNVALPKNYKMYMIDGCNDIEIKCKLYADSNMLNTLNAVKWEVQNISGIKDWCLKEVEVRTLDLTQYDRGIRVAYQMLQQIKMSTFLNSYFDVHNMIPAGLGITNIQKSQLSTEPTYVKWDSITGKATIIDTEEVITQMPNISDVTEKLYDIGEKDYLEAVCGITELNGRVCYNRNSFLENTKFITQLQQAKTLKEAQITRQLQFVCKRNIKEPWYILSENIRKQVEAYWQKKALSLDGVYTGRKLFERVLYRVLDSGMYHSENVQEVALIKATIKVLVGNKVKAGTMLKTWSDILNLQKIPQELMQTTTNDSFDKLCKCINKNAKMLLLLFIQEIMHIQIDLVDTYKILQSKGLNFWTIISVNPYLMGYICKISELDCDKLAILTGVYTNETLKMDRIALYVHNKMMDVENTKIHASTMLPLCELKTLKYTLSVPKAWQESVENFGLFESLDVRQNVQTYLGIDPNAFTLAQGVYKHNSSGIDSYTFNLKNVDIVEIYTKQGSGVRFNIAGNDVIVDIDYLRMELGIYELCRKHSKKVEKEITNAEIATCVAAYEQKKAAEWGIEQMHLELKQLQATQLVNQKMFAIMGGAGMGKTTITELLTYILQETQGITDESVLYIAPIGKAAVRLKDVVHKPTMTIHSACAIGVDENKMHRRVRTLSQYKIVVVDESSMIDLNTMFTLLQALPDDCWVIFVGDTAQLASVGAGKPYALMVQYLPVVTLEVGKRVNANSLIAQNSNAILKGSADVLKEGHNYIIKNVPESKCADYIEDICRFHLYNERKPGMQYIENLQGIKPIDIQVATPVKRVQYSWGCQALNKKLRTLFNSSANYSVSTKGVGGQQIKYSVGDRVVHTKNNRYAARYKETEQRNCFEVIPDFEGVMNGEIGTIKYIIDGAYIQFKDPKNANLQLTDVEQNILAQKRKNKIYMFVAYQDVDIKTMQPMQYLVCYPLRKVEIAEQDEKQVSTFGIIKQMCMTEEQTSIQALKEKRTVQPNKQNYIVEYEDLKTLQLAYALTVHKLEGSEMRIVICVIYGVQMQSFLTRNLLYTMLTRATDGIYLIGDILGDSAFNKALTVDMLQQRYSIFDYYNKVKID